MPQQISFVEVTKMSESSLQYKSQAIDSTQKVPCPFDEEFLRLVRYLCSCGHLQPLCRLYFCRYCSDLRCGQCVSHEVDSHYCPNCLENMPSAEARLKKNRCANCFDCPSCGHTLSTRATSMTVASQQVEGVDGQPSKPTTKKVYYLACGFCRWTTRDIGLADQSVASGGWPEPENPDAARFASLEDHYRSIAQREKLEKESRRFLGRKLSYMQLADKYGLSAAVARRKAGLPPIIQRAPTSDSTGEKNSGQAISVAPSEAKSIEDVEELDSTELFSKEPDLCRITRLEQRLMQIDTQPSLTADVYPRHKHLVVKRSQRCRICEHNLSKPEYNPSSIKFKIQLAAFYHVPELIIYQLANNELTAGKDFNFMLKVTNPAQHPTYIELFDLDDYFEQEEISNNKSSNEGKQDGDQNMSDGNQISSKKSELALGSKIGSNSQGQLNFPLKASMLAAKYKRYANAKFVSLTHDSKTVKEAERVKTYLPARDDAAEFDDHDRDFPPGIVDEPRIVAWRKSNKVGIKATAKLNCDLKSGTEVVTGFALRFLYTNTVPSLEQREIQTSEVTIPVFVVLGICDT